MSDKLYFFLNRFITRLSSLHLMQVSDERRESHDIWWTIIGTKLLIWQPNIATAYVRYGYDIVELKYYLTPNFHPSLIVMICHNLKTVLKNPAALTDFQIQFPFLEHLRRLHNNPVWAQIPQLCICKPMVIRLICFAFRRAKYEWWWDYTVFNSLCYIETNLDWYP